MDLRVLGCPDRFESLCKLLLQREYPSIQTVDGRPGDQGRDCFLGTFADSRVVFQIKYFERLASSQRKQVQASLGVASKSKPTKWVLLIPLEFTKYDWKWFGKLGKKYHPIELEVWQAPKITSLVLDKKNEGLKELFPELFLTTTIIDRTVVGTIEKMGLQARKITDSLLDQISETSISEEELSKLVRESRTRQYSAEIIASRRWLAEFDSKQKALQTMKEVYEKAVVEGDTENELAATYGLLCLLDFSHKPDVEFFRLAERGIELSLKLEKKDVAALIESRKFMMNEWANDQRHYALLEKLLRMTIDGTSGHSLPALVQEVQSLEKSEDENKALVSQAATHALESLDVRTFAMVIMDIGFSIGTGAFQQQSFVGHAETLINCANRLLEMAADILRKTGDDAGLTLVESNTALFWSSVSNKEKAEAHANAALDLAGKTKNRAVERVASNILREMGTGVLNFPPVLKKKYTPEAYRKTLRFVVERMGVDMHNPASSIDQTIKVGIDDLNPERVLKFCYFMRVDQLGTAFLGQLTGIPTIGFKRISCRKVHYTKDGFALDGLFESFKRSHCDACEYRKPRDPSWKWTLGWQKDKNRGHNNLDI